MTDTDHLNASDEELDAEVERIFAELVEEFTAPKIKKETDNE